MKMPLIPESEKTSTVIMLLEMIQELRQEVARLKDEIALLKGEKPRPTIKPSSLEEPPGGQSNKQDEGKKRAGSEKRSKTATLQIHETPAPIKPEHVPSGSRFKGYEVFVVQDLKIENHNTLYRREVWIGPDGTRIVGALPPQVVATAHFGPTLTSFILHQYHHQRVTEPRLLEFLRELGIDISSGQLNRILTEDKQSFHEEKGALLKAGLEVSIHVNADDTTARHDGKNGYCTYIGNEFFAWFASTESKSRINFLELLRAGEKDYRLTEEAYAYMAEQGLPQAGQTLLKHGTSQVFATEQDWRKHLEQVGITQERHSKIATEAALLGSVLFHRDGKELVIVSDDAGQFDVLIHGLCWFHAERTINKLIPYTEECRQALEKVRSDIWNLYANLKQYKTSPNQAQKLVLEANFDDIFCRHTCFVSLNQALKRIANNKPELLLVLEKPTVPLHNNTAERDIREYVTKRKISGSTRSDLGRQARDTFTSLKKTAQKLGVSFWAYLQDRISGKKIIPQLSNTLRQKVTANSS